MTKQIFFLFLVSSALTITDVTGTTPPTVPCPNSLCNERIDGNYEYHYKGEYRANYFLQCLGGLAYCQACWPMSLEFSGKCNQCLYSKKGKISEKEFKVIKVHPKSN